MTDYDKVKALFTELGIGFTEHDEKDNVKVICCEAGSDKVIGYSGFFTDFEFDEDGKFIQMGVWE